MEVRPRVLPRGRTSSSVNTFEVAESDATVFFEWYGDHRDLHSFPTRRSSDLVLPRILWLFIAHGHVIRPGSWRVLSGDRKSTRLNSSHVEISYAVFCLKKKTTYDLTLANAIRVCYHLPCHRTLFHVHGCAVAW